MQTLYNSDNYVVVQFDVPASPETPGTPARGGFEIVDKFARKEIFIQGALAESFKQGVHALSQNDPTVEQFDDYISGFTALAQQPLMLH